MVLAEQLDFNNTPFTDTKAAEKFFGEVHAVASSIIKGIGGYNNLSTNDTDSIRQYSPDQYVKEFKGVYRLITAEDHMSAVNQVILDTQERGESEIPILDLCDGKSDIQMMLFLENQAAKHNISIDRSCTSPRRVHIDDVAYSGSQKSSVMLKEVTTLYLAGITDRALTRLQESYQAVKSTRLIPTTRDLFSREALIIFAIQHEVSRRYFLNGKVDFDTFMQNWPLVFDEAACITAYKLPDETSLNEVFRECNGIELFPKEARSFYPMNQQ